MEKNDRHIERLISRYFEALTSEAEERELRRFLAGEAGADARYDEVRAVMGYLSTGRRLHAVAAPPTAGRPTMRLRKKVLRYAAVLAAGLLLGGGGLYVSRQAAEDEVCVAYVQGRRVTETEAVLAQMRMSVKNVTDASDELSVETQLGDMFEGL